MEIMILEKLSPDFNYGMPTKGGHHRGPDSGDGVFNYLVQLSPAEMAEFDKNDANVL